MQLTIVQAQLSELETVLDILEEAAQWLTGRGIHQWLPGSFYGVHCQSIANRLRQGEIYLAKVDGEAIGTLRLQWSDRPMWGEMPDDAGYVHSLAVRRAFAGMGVGRQLLQWAENTAAANGKQYLRLDCTAENPVLRSYYEQAGFTHRGDIEDNDWKASLYEKSVTQNT